MLPDAPGLGISIDEEAASRYSFKPFDRPVIEQADGVLRSLVGEDIEFLTILNPDLGMTLGDKQEIEQVLTTLLVNARDALPVGGTVTIETSNVEGDLEDGATRSESNVELRVSATGYGVQPAPGTSSLDVIVARCGGQLRVTSEAEKGTIFRMYLPRIDSLECSGDTAENTTTEES
jgi:signal transduction histidine kinase